MDNKIIFSSKGIEVSEDNKGNLILDFILCDFNANSNGKKINRENVEDKIQTMVNMPLVGRLKTTNGVTDFMGHNKKVKYEKVGNEIVNRTFLDTDAFGVFTECCIKEIDNIEYICGKAILWNRFENAKRVILERFESGDAIKSSWEMVVTESHPVVENGKNIDIIDDFYFIANCLLGSRINPAFKCAGIQELQVAEEENGFDEELSSAIALDINNLKEGGDIVEKEKLEVSSLSISDLRTKVCRLAYELEEDANYDYWLYDSIIYPLENTVYFSKEGRDSIQEDYLKVVYEVNQETNEVSIVSKEDVKMTFVPKESVVEVSELETVKTELSTKEANLIAKETELSEKINSIVELGKTIAEKDALISEKDTVIAELNTFKEQVAEIEAEKAEKELAKKREKCKSTALSSGYITEEEIETSEELKNAIFSCDENAIKLYIAEAVIKKNSEKNLEVSEEEKEVEVSTDLGTTVTYEYNGETGNPISDFLKKSKKRR